MNDILANPAMAVLFAFMATLVTSAIKNPAWPAWAKQALAVAVAGVAGIAVVALRIESGGIPDWSFDVVVGHIATVLSVGQAAYWFLLNGKGTPAAALNVKLEQLGTKPGGGA